MIQLSNNSIIVTVFKRDYTVSVQAIIEMREWVSDCTWAEDDYEDDWISELSDEQIVRNVHVHYDGGINGFLRAMAP